MAEAPEFWNAAPSPYGHLRAAPSWHLRASDADRERAVDVLKAGFAEGRLTREELSARQARALAARTYGELAALTADLPVGPLGTLAAPVPPGSAAYRYPLARKTNKLAIASLVAALLPFYGTVPASVMGHAARSQIRGSNEGGGALAAAALAIGYLNIVLILLFMLFLSLR